MTPRVLVPLAEGFEEIEAVTVIDILRRAAIEVVVAGITGGPVEGSRGIRIVADTTLAELDTTRDWDMIVLPGGAGGTARLKADPVVRMVVDRLLRDNKPIAAICAAPTVLHAFGALEGATATCHPTVEAEMTGVSLSRERVVVDGNLITSRAAGTAMEFAYKLVEILAGPDRCDAIDAGVLARQHS